jgi:hypothetical protein
MANLELLNIYTSSLAGFPMESQTSVEVDQGGIIGDRYHIDPNGLAQGTHSIKRVDGKGRIPNKYRAATIFSDGDFADSMEKFNGMLKEEGLSPVDFTPIMMRRNFFVRGRLGLLNELLDLGEAVELNNSELSMLPIEKCTPCNLPPTYILDAEGKLKPGMDGHKELGLVQKAFKTAFAETAGIRTAIIKPGRVNI